MVTSVAELCLVSQGHRSRHVSAAQATRSSSCPMAVQPFGYTSPRITPT
jgi:hypothetical protein